MAVVQPKKVSNWMVALSDFMIANPEARAYEAAMFFNVGESWVSIVKNSDAFKNFHNARRDLHFDKISETVVDKVQGLTELALDELTDRVETDRGTMPVRELTEISKMALNSLGFGGKNSVQVNVNQDNKSVTINDSLALQRSREKMDKLRTLNDTEILTERAAAVEVLV